MQNTISVVIPAYNSAGRIEATLESVLAQTAEILEIIVVNDGSTDNTSEVAENYSTLVRVIRQENAGPSAARNRGIAECKGDWIAFLDDDDLWHPDKLAQQLQILVVHSELDLLACAWTRSLPITPSGKTGLSHLSYVNLLTLNRFQTSTVVIRASTVANVGSFNPDLDGVEDWDYWLRVSKEHHIAVLDEPLVFYRDRPEGVSKNLEVFYDHMRVMLAREKTEELIDPTLMKEIMVWHQLRLFVGFLLIRRYSAAVNTVIDLVKDGLVREVPPATKRYLLPFLSSRVQRRLQSKLQLIPLSKRVLPAST